MIIFPTSSKTNMSKQQLKWWQVGLITLAASGLGALSTRKTHQEEQQLYNKELKQAPWAPPGWVFGPVWSANNFFLVKALDRIRQLEDSDVKKKLLIKQAVIWTIFFSFGYVYFKKKSTLLAALWTMSDAALALSSYSDARKVDKQLANQYLPLFTWTTFASSVAAYQAYVNKDEVFKIAPAEVLEEQFA
jgi:tryptophan-rich sensory protein